MIHWLWVLGALQAGVLIGLWLASIAEMAGRHPWEDAAEDDSRISQESL